MVEEGSFDTYGIEDITLKVPNEAVDAYKSAYLWKEFNIVGFDATGIESVKSEVPTTDVPTAIYTLNGQKVSQTQKGQIYLFRYGNGKTVKRLVK